MMQSLAKNIGAAVLGWIVMAAGVFGLMTVMWFLMGPDRAFLSGSWEVTWGWLLGSIAIGLLAGVAGGFVCSRIADRWGVGLLVALVVVLGVLVAMGSMEMTGIEGVAEADPGPRPDDVGILQAMQSARQPPWLTWLNPLLGAVGVIVGSRRKRPPVE